MAIYGKNKTDSFTVSAETAILMVEPKEEFYIGEVFLYKPIGSDTVMRLAVRDCTDKVSSGSFALEDCKSYCAIEPWCCKDGNCKAVRNPETARLRNEWFVPQCHAHLRDDSKDVYFEEVDGNGYNR
jgi:hypothetical protein